jgi:hypothetical protein
VAEKPSKPNNGLTKSQAVDLAEEFVRILQQAQPSDPSRTNDEIAVMVAAGLRLFDGRLLPTLTENVPGHLQVVVKPFTEAVAAKSATEDTRMQFPKDFAGSPETGAGLIEFLAKSIAGATPETVIQIRGVLKELALATSNQMIVREQLVESINKNMRGKPGPTKSVKRDDWDRVVQSSNDLRPAILEMLEVAEKNATKPLATVIDSVSLLHAEWSGQFRFLMNNLPLVERTLKLAKVKRAKTRGKATKLADSLACQFVGLEVAPSYSLQQVEQIRRSLKKG